MVLIVDGHKFQYEMENLCRVFFPNEHIEVTSDTTGDIDEKLVVTTSLKEINIEEIELFVSFQKAEKNGTRSEIIRKDINTDLELKMADMLFNLLCNATNYTPKWGILTGVRPSKLMTKLIEEMGEEKAKEYFENSLKVSPQKTNLAFEVSKLEEKIIEKSKPNSFSLYVSIPFCPSRCSYCSFVSHSITSPTAKKLLPEYFDLLCEEIRETSKMSKEIGLNLETIYIGGGTPSILSADQIDKLLSVICFNFDITNLREFTFEAGRPDTIDAEKLEIIKKYPVTRISINPQTFSDDVLKEIGRNHSAQRTIEIYNLAREIGFTNINMDIIAGLPTDTLQSFENTLNTLLDLSPSNITVHTLALKRSSNLNNDIATSNNGKLACDMVDLAAEMLSKNDYLPYYMYRQSKSVGNLENVGWCKEGFEGYYNIYMMEECHTVLAVGAGAVIKLKSPSNNYIERIFNFKYPYEYNTRFETILERKQEIYKFYELQNFGG